MKTKPHRPNVPALIKLHKVSVWRNNDQWGASVKTPTTTSIAIGCKSKRKAVLGVLEQAGLPLLPPTP